MMKQFNISGCIVDSDIQRETFEDVTPAQFNSFIKGLDKGDNVELIINSCGGSVTSGIAIASAIQRAQANGHQVVAKIEGLCASIASVIACACSKITMTESSFVMIHNCWGIVQGNSADLRKEADLMDKMNEAIISFYRSKFNKTDDELKAMMDAETWIVGKDAAEYGLKCEVIPDVKEYKIAAKIQNFNFNKVPRNIMENKEIVDEKTPEEQKQNEEVIETIQKALEEEEQKQEEKQEEKQETIVENLADDFVPKAEVDKRVSGMQSAMAKQIDQLHKDYEAKITDFQNQLKVKDEELISVKAELTSLTTKLDETTKELSEMTSALEDKTQALAKLNANVNTPAEELPTMKDGLAKCMTPAEKVAFLSSGKYTH